MVTEGNEPFPSPKLWRALLNLSYLTPHWWTHRPPGAPEGQCLGLGDMMPKSDGRWMYRGLGLRLTSQGQAAGARAGGGEGGVKPTDWSWKQRGLWERGRCNWTGNRCLTALEECGYSHTGSLLELHTPVLTHIWGNVIFNIMSLKFFVVPFCCIES